MAGWKLTRGASAENPIMTTQRSAAWAALLLLAAHACAHAEEPIRPLIVAHRGLLQHAPENTLANFRACLELRLGFEFDVQRTKDGQLVCIHDDTVDRTTDGTGNVAELTLEQIRRLDAGSWFDSKFAGEKVPTLEEVLSLVAEHREKEVLIAVDLKAAGVEQEVVRLAEQHQVLHRLLFIGRTISEPHVRERIKAAATEPQTASVANHADEFDSALTAPNTDFVYFRYVPAAAPMKAVRDAGKKSFIAGATVSGNEPENWEQAAEVGIDGILTDFPLELRAMLRKKRGR
jgi:glycerophosphoryl diester phosphodiesterase